MIRPRLWRDAVVLVPGPARFDSPQLRAAIAAPIAPAWRCRAGNRHERPQETCDCKPAPIARGEEGDGW